MNTSYIPGPLDANLQLENAITKTATYAGTAFDKGNGFAPGGVGMPVAAVVNTTALDLGSGNETYTATLTESDDDATYTDISPAVAITAVGNISVPGFLSKRYTKLKLTLGGTTPSISLSAFLTPIVC